MSVLEDADAPVERLSPLQEFCRAPGAFIRERPHVPLVPLILVVVVGAWEVIVRAGTATPSISMSSSISG